MARLDRYSYKEKPTSTKFNQMVDVVNEHEEALSKKQPLIDDLDAIRAGAKAGATALQPVEGKGLSSNDYTNDEKQKVADNAQKVSELSLKVKEVKVKDATITDDTLHITKADGTEIEFQGGGDIPEGVVVDPEYVHTDNNYTDEDKGKLVDADNKVSQAQEAATSAAMSAEQTEQHMSALQEAIQNLPDGQAVSAQVAMNTAKLDGTLPQVEEDGFHVADAQGNIGMRYDGNGLDAAKVNAHFVEVLKASGVATGSVIDSVAVEVEEDGFFFVDEQLNVGVKVDSDGIHAKNILEYEIIND